MSSIKS
jgi:hypothetical protein